MTTSSKPNPRAADCSQLADELELEVCSSAYHTHTLTKSRMPCDKNHEINDLG